MITGSVLFGNSADRIIIEYHTGENGGYQRLHNSLPQVIFPQLSR